MSAPRVLTFFGGAATATGSMMLLEAAGARVLLDAGLFEGDTASSDAKNRALPLDPQKVDAVLLSQAALAYAGRCPQLVKHGFDGPIYATPGTRDVAAVLLAEAAVDLEARGEGGLFTLPDVFATQARIVGQPYQRSVHLRRNLVFEFADAGHILGSASIELRTGEGGSHRIIYSGCVGRSGSAILRDPMPPSGPVDTLIVGSPFAAAAHQMFAAAQQRLTSIINDTVARGGQIIVPASSLGPMQEFVRVVQSLWRRGAIPEIPVFIDTTMPASLPTLLRLHPEVVSHAARAYADAGGVFDESLLHYAAKEGQREGVETLDTPALIIASGESGGAGRAAFQLRRCLGDERNTVLLLSFQEEGSVGHALLTGAAEVRIGGEMVARRAAVEEMSAFSGHADGEEMRTWVRALGGPVKRAFVVHGDDLSVAMMVTILREEGVRDVIVPREGESFPF